VCFSIEPGTNSVSSVSVRLCCVWQQFDAVIQAADEGKPADLSKMPPPPGQPGMLPHRCSVVYENTVSLMSVTMFRHHAV